MSDEVLTVTELERLAVRAEQDIEINDRADWCRNVTLARVCRHALALEAEVARWRGELAQLRCIFCGHAVSRLDPEACAKMAGHLMTCPEHPLAIALAENDRLRRQVEGQRHEVHDDDGDAA